MTDRLGMSMMLPGIDTGIVDCDGLKADRSSCPTGIDFLPFKGSARVGMGFGYPGGAGVMGTVALVVAVLL